MQKIQRATSNYKSTTSRPMTAFGPKSHNRQDLLKTLQKAIIQKGGVPFLKKLLKPSKKQKKRSKNQTCDLFEVQRIRQPS